MSDNESAIIEMFLKTAVSWIKWMYATSLSSYSSLSLFLLLSPIMRVQSARSVMKAPLWSHNRLLLPNYLLKTLSILVPLCSNTSFWGDLNIRRYRPKVWVIIWHINDPLRRDLLGNSSILSRSNTYNR